MKNRGYITFISVLTIAAIGSVVAISLLTFGTLSTHSTLIAEQGIQARHLAHGCVEIALQEVSQNASFWGSDTITPFGTGSCAYDVSGGSIEATGLVGDVTQRVFVSFTTNPVEITSWQEVAEF